MTVLGSGVLAGTGETLQTGWHVYAPEAPGTTDSGAGGGVELPGGIDLSGVVPAELVNWYRPAHNLGQRSVELDAGVARLLSGSNPSRKFVAVCNLDPAITVWLGDSSQVTAGGIGNTFAGFPLFPLSTAVFKADEFDGDLFGLIAASAANSVDVRVIDPSRGY